VVKAACTNLIFASVGVSFGFAVLISVFDLLPLVIAGKRIRAVAEAIGATARWLAIVVGFFLVRFPIPLLIVYAVSTWIYFRERTDRIRRGKRFDYGWLHCLEHLAIWVFLLVVNGSKLDIPLVWRLHAGLFLSIAVLLATMGIITNFRIFGSVEKDLPPWFDPLLCSAIVQKSRANAFSHRLQHYVIKPFTPKMVNESVGWPDIESMLAEISLNEPFDVAVGITSGGAFIARCVAARFGIPSVHYVRSRFWSRMPLRKNLVASFRYYAGLPNDTNVSFLDGNVDLTGKRVLIVDDSVCTGATLASVDRLCRAKGADHVRSLALFVNPEHSVDYFCRMSKTPLIWPWGWESD
jgi:adenine/guanine phosphoribosyltransferase-like PRPP-binding protein